MAAKTRRPSTVDLAAKAVAAATAVPRRLREPLVLVCLATKRSGSASYFTQLITVVVDVLCNFSRLAHATTVTCLLWASSAVMPKTCAREERITDLVMAVVAPATHGTAAGNARTPTAVVAELGGTSAVVRTMPEAVGAMGGAR